MRPMNEHDKREILSAIESARDGVTKASHAQAQKTRELIRSEHQATNRYFGIIIAQLERITTAVESRIPPTWNVIRVTDLDTGLVTQGRIEAMQLTDTQKVKVTFGKPVDLKGFPAQIQGDPVFAVSDDAVTLTPVDGDPFSINVIAAHPSAFGGDGVTPVAGTLTITGDADLGDGVKSIVGSESYIVTSGAAAGFGPATVATPEEQ